MSFLAPSFLIFILIFLFIYYLIPKQFQWHILLIASLFFYCWGGRYKAVIYLLCTAFSTWLAALIIDILSGWTREYLRLNKELSLSERKAVKERLQKTKKKIFLCGMILNILILCIIKYTNFVIKNIVQFWNIFAIPKASVPVWDFLVPIGISFYTFQSLGYLIDIYWGKYKAERSFAKYLLFVSYFPQIVQGPIGRHDQLAVQLTKQNRFRCENLKHGAILMLWGYMKKLVIADRIAPLVITVCQAPKKYDGSIIVLAILSYAIQLYADFSGGIDIVTGVSQLFGIRLSPNFMRPYFAVSLGDFWRRWHISLGAWMRDYVFYPFARSKLITKTCKKLKELHKGIASLFPAIVGNILVFFLVGLWHGAEWRYIFWGLYNGIILALSVLFKPLYSQFYEKVPKIKGNCLWHIFEVVRTFVIVCIGYYFDCCTEISEALLMLKKSIFDFHLSILLQDNILKLGMEKWDYIIVAVAVLLLLIVSFFQEQGIQIRFWIDKRNILLRWTILYGLLFFVIAFSVTGVNTMEGFMYAIF